MSSFLQGSSNFVQTKLKHCYNFQARMSLYDPILNIPWAPFHLFFRDAVAAKRFPVVCLGPSSVSVGWITMEPPYLIPKWNSYSKEIYHLNQQRQLYLFIYCVQHIYPLPPSASASAAARWSHVGVSDRYASERERHRMRDGFLPCQIVSAC